MRGRQGRGAGALAPLQGAHCAERAGWPLPSRARPVGPVRQPRVLETRRVFDARGRPGLKANHAATPGRAGTFRHAAKPVRRDGPHAPARRPPASKGARREGRGGRPCQAALHKPRYRWVFLPAYPDTSPSRRFHQVIPLVIMDINTWFRVGSYPVRRDWVPEGD